MLILPSSSDGPSASAAMGASAERVCAELVRAGVTHAVTVPDFVQFSVHDRLAASVDGIRQVFACTEDQALTTAAGLHVGGAKPVVMVQNQGLYKVMNTLRAVCVDARIPVVLLVGQFGREEENLGAPMRHSRRNMVRLLEPTLDAFDIPHWPIDDDGDLRHVATAFATSVTRQGAAALLFGRCTAWN